MSRRQEVIDAVITELKKITIANGYQQDIGEVGFIFKRPDRVNAFPAALAHTGAFEEAKERFPTRSKQADLALTITLYAEYDQEGRDLHKLISDVEKALETDPTLGKTYVIDTWVAGVSSMEDEEASEGPVNRTDLEVRIIYRHARATP